MSWDTAYVIASSVHDTLFLRPRLLAGRRDRLYVYDYGDHRVKAFDGSGALQWQFGGRGGGPDEFGNALSLTVAADGTIWVVDGGNARLAALSPNGVRTTLIPFPAPIRDVVPLHDELLATTVAPGDTFWIAIDRTGAVIRSGNVPIEELGHARLNVRQGYSATGDDHLTWATIFPFGSPFVVFRGRQLHCRGFLVEGRPFPSELPADPREAAWAIAAVVADTSLFVLPRGQTEHGLRVLDEYSLHDCRYLRTVTLPGRIVSLAYSQGLFYFGFEDPVPAIVAARMRP